MNEYIKQISERIRELRDILDMDAEDVARAIGVSKDEYLAYRNAKSLNTIEAYEKYLSLYGKGEYGMEITASLIHLKQLKELLEGSKKYKGK